VLIYNLFNWLSTMACGRGQENSNAYNDLIRRLNVFCSDYNELLKVRQIIIVSVNIYNAILPHLVESPVDHMTTS
jgi:hypothetical protein